MPRTKRPNPKYRLHRQSGQAIVTLPDHVGRRRDVLLGPFNSEESKARYERELAEWKSSGGGRRSKARPNVPTIADVILQFKHFAEQHYRHPDGRLTSEISVYRRAVRELREIYGDEPADEFGPLKLKAVRQRMIENNVSRRVVNMFVRKIRSIFRWASSEELVPVRVVEALRTVTGLQRGRTVARELEPIKPVNDAHVEAILGHVNPSIRAMITLQSLTGMRPSEVCSIRATDIDRSGDIWLYRPGQHKTAWRGRDRVITLGPKAQATIRPFFSINLASPLFSPRRERERRYADLRAKRLSKVQPSQRDRSKPNAKLLPKDAYSKDSYRAAIANAIEKANAAMEAAATAAGRKVAEHERIPHWHPNQLRHSLATKVRRRFGLEAAQVALGHANADVTQVYAEANVAEAVNIARQIG